MEKINHYADKEDLVCDIFSGSVAVAFELKKQGYRVACNDINLFSYFYGKHLIEQCSIPAIQLEDFIETADADKYKAEAELRCNDLSLNTDGFLFLNSKKNKEQYLKLLTLLLYLQNISKSQISKKFQNSFIYDTYTEEGNNSKFVSLRGTGGSRKFFTPENGKKIDNILNKIREWKLNGLLNDGYLYYTLICTLIDSVEKVSNTQGTYHDFPRDVYDSRALQKLTLRPPGFDGIIAKKLKHIIGKEEDSLLFIQRVPKHKVLYLDPPYNFRQYTSYYFLPNILCRYCEIENLEDYFSKVNYVRGQNMEDDFTSTFCKKSQFIDSVRNLITSASCDHVLLSYFDGRNHWNNSAEQDENKGFEVINKLFSEDLFQADKSFHTPVKRLNYQSYGGCQAKVVNELIFYGEIR